MNKWFRSENAMKQLSLAIWEVEMSSFDVRGDPCMTFFYKIYRLLDSGKFVKVSTAAFDMLDDFRVFNRLWHDC